MRKLAFAWVVIALYFGFSTPTHAQNLVLNPSFEIIDSCPSSGTSHSIQYARHCFDIDAPFDKPTPDLYNLCAWHNIFNNSFIARPPRTGNSCVGIITYYNKNYVSIKYREYVGMTLSEPLKKDTLYFVSFYTRIVEGASYGCNNMSIYFAHQKPVLYADTQTYSIKYPLDSIPQIIEKKIIYSYEWVKIQGSFTAKGGERYLIIGNMFDNSSTEIISIYTQGHEDMAYYTIDDVCVSTRANECEVSISSIENMLTQDASVYQLYPNPSFDKVFLQGQENDACMLTWYNSMGAKVKCSQVQSGQSVDVSDLPKGAYIVHIQGKKGFTTQKMLIY